jgi:ElaB/YqjD/DUF883 family membrane-anchored ribosome-binding protein
MPTAKAKQETDDLREELQALRKEVSEMMSILQSKGGSYAEELGEKVSDKLDSYQENLKESAETAYEMGGEGVDEIGKRIRKNPITSLCVAFGIGYLISKVMDHNR